jgi:protein TonB
MKLLITSEFRAPEPTKPFIIDIVKPFEMSAIIEPPLTNEPPPPPKEQPEAPERPSAGSIPIAFVNDSPKLPDLQPGKLELSDGAYLPLVRIQPAYPRRAMSRGIEGYTVVEFDITEHGLVSNPRVIEAYPGPVFNNASLTAISKFRFKPQVSNGSPVKAFGARNKFRFELSGTYSA